jgi:uncharacterized DUF497 family protein
MTNDSPIITWDERKNAINQKKHKLAFELAQYVFNDARHLVENNGIVDGEQRWLAVGRVGVATIIVVAHTYEDDLDLRIAPQLARFVNIKPLKTVAMRTNKR